MIGNGGDEVTTDDLTYPMPGFPREEENSTEDWVPVDGKWHNLVYVHHPHGVATDLYVDGKLVPASGEQEPINGFRRWDKALSRAQVERIYAASQPKPSYHELVEAAGGKFVDLSKGGKP